MSFGNEKFRTDLPVVIALAVLLVAPAAFAQEEPYPRTEVFVGYAWLHPGGDLRGANLRGIAEGWGVNVTFNGAEWVGFSIDAGSHHGDQATIGTVMFGPRFAWRQEGITLFGTGLVGLHRLAPAGENGSNGIGLGAGGGIDLNVNRRVSLRVFEATYIWGHHTLAPPPPNRLNLTGARLRAGVVFKLGYTEEPIPPSASCSAQPASVMAGEPVQVTATTQNFRTKRPLNYEWNATGGRVEGTGETVRVDTAGLAPGSYTVTARISERQEMANCNASFTIQEPPRNPPVISCSINPTTVRSGDAATITCQASSPDQRPITYTWRSSGGRLTPANGTATLDTAGAPAGPITVDVTVSDDRGLTAQARTQLTVEVPPPPPQASRLNEISFARNNARVDNEAKAILDEVALRLQRDADATAVVVGNYEQGERNGPRLAAQRANNTKAYLSAERGIDPSRIEVRTGQAGTGTVIIWLVPAGATFAEPGTEIVPETPTRR